jgi:hypothetical protein
VSGAVQVPARVPVAQHASPRPPQAFMPVPHAPFMHMPSWFPHVAPDA